MMCAENFSTIADSGIIYAYDCYRTVQFYGMVFVHIAIQNSLFIIFADRLMERVVNITFQVFNDKNGFAMHEVAHRNNEIDIFDCVYVVNDDGQVVYLMN